MTSEAPSQSATSAQNAEPDWAEQIVDSLESMIESVRSKTSDKAVGVAKILVYSLLGAGLGGAVLLLITIGFVRGLDVALPGAVWSAYLVLGGMFIAIGALLWSRRSRTA